MPRGYVHSRHVPRPHTVHRAPLLSNVTLRAQTTVGNRRSGMRAVRYTLLSWYNIFVPCISMHDLRSCTNAHPTGAFYAILVKTIDAYILVADVHYVVRTQLKPRHVLTGPTQFALSDHLPPTQICQLARRLRGQQYQSRSSQMDLRDLSLIAVPSMETSR